MPPSPSTCSLTPAQAFARERLGKVPPFFRARVAFHEKPAYRSKNAAGTGIDSVEALAAASTRGEDRRIARRFPTPMKIYRDENGVALDALFRGDEVDLRVLTAERSGAPIGSQEVWAAGVTYYRSREARMEESEKQADVYDRVYEAERPELFFKATPHRVVGNREPVRIRSDSTWNVPEAELALAVNRHGRIFGYSIGNDMSSRSIEGENPLYLPQAKIYDGCCALGPCLYLSDEPLPKDTEVSLEIERSGSVVFTDVTTLEKLKREPEELVRYLFRESSFPSGCYLLTGTGIVPPAEFSLAVGDVVSITIEPIGTLVNPVS